MIYFFRHAQSEANKKGVYAGSILDTSLTKEGVLKFRDVAKNNEIVFSKIFVSTLSRSIESGKIFQREQSYPLEMIIDERIHELNFGKLTGSPYIEFDTQQAYSEFGIESKYSFYSRIKSFYDDIKDEEDAILIIGHAGVAKMLQAIIAGTQVELYNEIPQVKQYNIYQL